MEMHTACACVDECVHVGVCLDHMVGGRSRFIPLVQVHYLYLYYSIRLRCKALIVDYILHYCMLWWLLKYTVICLVVVYEVVA